MKSKALNIETMLLLFVSIGLLVISHPSTQLRLLNITYYVRLFANRTDIFSRLLVVYGLFLLACSILSYIYSLHDTTLILQLNKYYKNIPLLLQKDVTPSIQHCFVSNDGIIWLIIALIIGVGLRGYFLAQPMRYDEAYTFLNFVDQEFSKLFFYPLPNNHVLHSILVKISTFVWGEHPASIRLPAFLAGVGLIPLTFCLSRTLKQSGIFASIAIAVSPYLVLYSTNARGYSLLVFLTVGLAFVGIHVVRKLSASGVTVLSLIAALGMFTIPSMLFSIVSIYCWLTCLLFVKGQSPKTILYKFIIPSGLITIAFTIILYTPVIFVSNGAESIVANRFVQSQTWQVFFSQISPHFQATIVDFSRDIPKGILLIYMVLVTIGLYGSMKERDWPTLLILPSILFASGIVFFVKHKIPFARTWIYIIPFVFIVADSGFTYILRKISYKPQLFFKVTIVILGIIITISLISTNRIVNYPDTGTFAEAQIVANYLKPIMTTNDIISVRTPANFPTYFYLWYYGVPEFDLEESNELREFIVVQKSQYSITDMTDKPVINLFDLGDMSLYQVVQGTTP